MPRRTVPPPGQAGGRAARGHSAEPSRNTTPGRRTPGGVSDTATDRRHESGAAAVSTPQQTPAPRHSHTEPQGHASVPCLPTAQPGVDDGPVAWSSVPSTELPTTRTRPDRSDSGPRLLRRHANQGTAVTPTAGVDERTLGRRVRTAYQPGSGDGFASATPGRSESPCGAGQGPAAGPPQTDTRPCPVDVPRETNAPRETTVSVHARSGSCPEPRLNGHREPPPLAPWAHGRGRPDHHPVPAPPDPVIAAP